MKRGNSLNEMFRHSISVFVLLIMAFAGLFYTSNVARACDILIKKTANPENLPAEGGKVEYTYTITNPGVVELKKVRVTDDKCDSVNFISGDENDNDKLDINETWIYKCSQNISETTANIATARGEYDGVEAISTDTATVTVETANPDIEVKKSADTASLPLGGGNVTYSYVVTNTGNITLSDIDLSDDKCDPVNFVSGDSNNNDKLETTEIWNYACQENITETLTNTATVTGKYGETSVTDTDNATVTVAAEVITPCIKVVKSASPVGLPAGGGNIVYSYVVTNTGNANLTNISLSDDKCSPVNFVSGDSNTNSILETTETWNYTCQKNITENTINIATVTGKFENTTVSDTDTIGVAVATPSGGGGGGGGAVLVLPPAISVIKTATPSALPKSGGDVTYNYTVKNTGSSTLFNVSLVDDKCKTITLLSGDKNGNKLLELNESWLYSCKMNLTETTTNTATATGYVGSTKVTDTDKVTVNLGFPGPSIKIVKYSNPIALPALGGEIIYSYIISNLGTAELTNISVTDDKCKDIKYGRGDEDKDNKLDSSEKWEFSCRMNITKDTTNFAAAKGYVGNLSSTDTTSHTVTVGKVVIVPKVMPKTGAETSSGDILGIAIIILTLLIVSIVGIKKVKILK